LIPALGGPERLLVRGGRYPHFSPDGRWIAYSSSTRINLAESKVFIIPVGGGTPKRIAEDIPWATSPVWSPDGRYLLVLGAASVNDFASLELWLISSEGRASMKTGLASILRARQISLFEEGPSVFSLDWIGDALFFGTDSSVWTIAIKNGSSQLGELRKLASGTTAMLGVRGSNSKLVFESRSLAAHRWSLRLDLNSGRVQGPMQQLPHSGGNQVMPASSSDGRQLVYLQSGPSSQELRLRDMTSGTERGLSNKRVRPKISPDGKKVKDESTKIERSTKWDGPRLVSEIKGLGSGKITETYSVDAEHHQLRVALQIENTRRPMATNHVYDADAAGR
jgi:WD40 repeat protein